MAELRARVLVVDDSPSMRQLLALAAGSAGADVTEAADGLAALKAITQAHFDVVFLDLNMPILDGHKLIQRLREDPAHDKTLICVVSTEGAESTERQSRSLGADEYLKKPITRRAIEDVVRAGVARRR